MKNKAAAGKVARGLGAVCLCGAGFLAFILSVIISFGWAAKSTKSDPDPTTAHILISLCVGSVILASSISCFVLARRLMRPVLHPEPKLENVR